MARPNKQGLDYFPLDVDIFSDEKTKHIGTFYGDTGIIVIIKLMCRIYRNGYYLPWDQDEELSFAKYEAYIPVKKLNLIINEALKRKFFDDSIYKEFKILTSRGIQARYFTACKLRKSIKVDSRYLLVNPKDYNNSIEIISGLTPINSELTPQRKVNKNKTNNERGDNVSTLSQFYNEQLSLIENDKNPTAIHYSQLVAYILEENELKTMLNGLLFFQNQLSFEEFNVLWETICTNLNKYKDALLKINDNIMYQKGSSLFTRLKSWFDQDKEPETLNPSIKPKKIYTPNHKINGTQH